MLRITFFCVLILLVAGRPLKESPGEEHPQYVAVPEHSGHNEYLKQERDQHSEDRPEHYEYLKQVRYQHPKDYPSLFCREVLKDLLKRAPKMKARDFDYNQRCGEEACDTSDNIRMKIQEFDSRTDYTEELFKQLKIDIEQVLLNVDCENIIMPKGFLEDLAYAAPFSFIG